jgi:hypothetical protein
VIQKNMPAKSSPYKANETPMHGHDEARNIPEGLCLACGWSILVRTDHKSPEDS